MTKATEIVYSQQRSNFVEGRAYANPRFFTTARSEVTKVYIVGPWPKIRAAYEAIGVEVEELEVDGVLAKPTSSSATALVSALSGDERAKVYIPDDWASLPWSRPTDAGLTLRGLAAVFADTPVLNKEDARNAIGAELARRAEGAEMREHIHAPAHDEHVHQPAWNEPSRDAEGRGVADVVETAAQ